MGLKRKPWLLMGGALLLLASFLLSKSFRHTIYRRQAIHKAQLESKIVKSKIQELHLNLTHLRSQPSAYEELVRKNLGYIRPGEKELRFYKSKGS